MLITKKLFLMLFCLSLILLGTTVPAHADDASWSGTFDDNSQLSTQHEDAPEWKGWFDLTAYNNTSTTWGDFHFLLFDYGGYNSNVVFVDLSGGGNDPTSTTTTIDTWTISGNGKSLDVFFYGDPVAPGETLNLKVWTDNTSNQQNFAVGFYPTVVPEPVSSTLFIIGGAALGFRRFRKK
jgi:hypothetical protein